jgi:hypothetical protein
VLLQGAAKNGYYPPAPRQQVQELLKDPSVGFCQQVRHQPSAPLPDDDPQEGQQAEGQQPEQAAAPAGKSSSDVDAQAAAAPAADSPAPAAEAAAADVPTPAGTPAAAAAEGAAATAAPAEGACCWLCPPAPAAS